MKFLILMTLIFGLAVAAPPSPHILTRKVRHQEEAAPVPASASSSISVATTGTVAAVKPRRNAREELHLPALAKNPSRNVREELHLPALANKPATKSDEGETRTRLQEAAQSFSLPGHASHDHHESVVKDRTTVDLKSQPALVPMELTLPRVERKVEGSS